MSDPVQVVVFFVGLTMWSEQVPNECGVRAILPRVAKPQTHHHVDAQTARDVSAPLHTKYVQEHKAAMVFPADSYLGHEGWDAPAIIQRGPNDRLYRYIVLDGDSLRFDTGEALNDSASLAGVVLPQLKQGLCPVKQRLRNPFTPPYDGAAAVITLPKGKLQASLSMPADSPGRLDTQLLLETDEKLVIYASTMRTKKELHLKPDSTGRIEVMIANVPVTYFDNDYSTPPSTAPDGLSHMHAYEAMSDPPTSGNCAKSVYEWFHELISPDPIADGQAVLAFPASGPVASPPLESTTMVTVGASFDCSNTQWP